MWETWLCLSSSRESTCGQPNACDRVLLSIAPGMGFRYLPPSPVPCPSSWGAPRASLRAGAHVEEGAWRLMNGNLFCWHHHSPGMLSCCCECARGGKRNLHCRALMLMGWGFLHCRLGEIISLGIDAHPHLYTRVYTYIAYIPLLQFLQVSPVPSAGEAVRGHLPRVSLTTSCMEPPVSTWARPRWE